MLVPPELQLTYVHIETPVGRLLVAGDNSAVRHIRFERHNRPEAGWQAGATGPLRRAAAQMGEYFARLRRVFDLPLAPVGTPFQRRVWDELQKIPYGQTLSYGAIARRIGEPAASRAVGAANGANPLPIVIPCHRAVGADGKLVGFGGGLEIKARLLELEAGQARIEVSK